MNQVQHRVNASMLQHTFSRQAALRRKKIHPPRCATKHMATKGCATKVLCIRILSLRCATKHMATKGCATKVMHEYEGCRRDGRNTLTFLLHTYFRHVTADNAQVPTTNDNFVHVTRTDSVNNPTTHSMCGVLARSSPGILPKVFKQVLQPFKETALKAGCCKGNPASTYPRWICCLH